jgi:ADP-ribose pyrophosphatase YjhB (NUDIX family)
VQRDGAVLLVGSRYPNLPEPLWHLPGGRPRDGETRRAAAERELAEETGLSGEAERLAYASESFDPARRVHVVSMTFVMRAAGLARLPDADAHVVDLAWVQPAELARKMSVAVVRDPLIAYLAGDERRYYEFTDARISIEFADGA